MNRKPGTPHKGWKKAARKRMAKPPLCEGCRINPSDPPSRLCPGCQAYDEHQK
jgi:hypothetical protein